MEWNEQNNIKRIFIGGGINEPTGILGKRSFRSLSFFLLPCLLQLSNISKILSFFYYYRSYIFYLYLIYYIIYYIIFIIIFIFISIMLCSPSRLSWSAHILCKSYVKKSLFRKLVNDDPPWIRQYKPQLKLQK